MHYIFLISFGTNKILSFKFVIQNFHFLKEIIIIIKTYHIITIDITKTIDRHFSKKKKKLIYTFKFKYSHIHSHVDCVLI